MKTTIGAFLISRLHALGIKRIYGVPGDYNLEFLELLATSNGLPFIGNCNELNAAYAADGEARLNGISAVLTTYGVGDLGALPGIAGAYAEGVPVISISGAPPLTAIRSKALLHHTLADGNYDNVMNCYREFSVACARITPENAAQEIDRVLSACWREKRPVYLQLPSDICYVEIDVPDTLPSLKAGASDTRRLAAAVEKITAKLAQAKRPILLADNMIRSQQIAPLLEQLIAHWQIPYAALSPAKAALSETSPYFMGIYRGKGSRPDLFNHVAESDFILGFDVRFIDSTSGYFTQSLKAEALIDVQPAEVRIDGVFYPGVRVADLLRALLEAPAPKRTATMPMVAAVAAPPVSGWTQDAFWQRMARFIAPGDVVIAENGTSNIGLSGQTLPAGCSYVAQPIWGAIGYTLPALLGTLLAAPERRQLLFIGDGSLQLTVQELSTILHHGLKPVIFVINNDGYTIERLILGENSAYNDIAAWRYTDLPGVFAPQAKPLSFCVDNMEALEDALAKAETANSLTLIEVKFPRMDAPAGMAAFCKKVTAYDYGAWAEEELAFSA